MPAFFLPVSIARFIGIILIKMNNLPTDNGSAKMTNHVRGVLP